MTTVGDLARAFRSNPVRRRELERLIWTDSLAGILYELAQIYADRESASGGEAKVAAADARGLCRDAAEIAADVVGKARAELCALLAESAEYARGSRL